jgi:hypothetical protein
MIAPEKKASRLDIDGRTVSDWRAKGFFDVRQTAIHAASAGYRT